ncbi:MAG: hypothetical protein ABIH78_02690 [Candidatus Peregrinibacteria bacterium]
MLTERPHTGTPNGGQPPTFTGLTSPKRKITGEDSSPAAIAVKETSEILAEFDAELRRAGSKIEAQNAAPEVVIAVEAIRAKITEALTVIHLPKQIAYIDKHVLKRPIDPGPNDKCRTINHTGLWSVLTRKLGIPVIDKNADIGYAEEIRLRIPNTASTLGAYNQVTLLVWRDRDYNIKKFALMEGYPGYPQDSTPTPTPPPLPTLPPHFPTPRPQAPATVQVEVVTLPPDALLEEDPS